MASVIPETETDIDTFARLLTICLSSADIGRIPAAVDEVVAGDASLLRASRKHIYLIGANEGAFPGSPDDGGLIGDADRELLATVGIELSDSEYRAADERFHFYRAASGASETLTISYACADLAGKAAQTLVSREAQSRPFSAKNPKATTKSRSPTVSRDAGSCTNTQPKPETPRSERLSEGILKNPPKPEKSS